MSSLSTRRHPTGMNFVMSRTIWSVEDAGMWFAKVKLELAILFDELKVDVPATGVLAARWAADSELEVCKVSQRFTSITRRPYLCHYFA